MNFLNLVNRILDRKTLLILFSFLVFAAFDSVPTPTASDTIITKRIYVFKIDQEIGPTMWRRTKLAVEKAIAEGYDLIFVELNTYGGAVDAADSIRTKLLNSPIPVLVLIENNAASAGALIALACDSIYMQPGSTIGAATVVDQSGTPVPDKYQSYMRKKMRATAEENNRDPEIAEGMVDPDKVIEGVSDSGKVITLTTKEALALNFCDAEVKSIDEALKHAKVEQYTLTSHQESTIDWLIGWLINPAISGVLVLIIIGGIYFELQTPGIGFPILASILAAIVYFAPLYLQGLADNWEILVFISGIVLLAIEVFVIPGFGIAGIAGLIFIVSGLALSLLANDGFDFTPVSTDDTINAFLLIILSVMGSLIGSIFLGIKLLNTSIFSKLVLNKSLTINDLNVDSQLSISNKLAGQEGDAVTKLMPTGKVRLNDEIFSATMVNGFAEVGEKVIVIREEGNLLYVKKI